MHTLLIQSSTCFLLENFIRSQDQDIDSFPSELKKFMSKNGCSMILTCESRPSIESLLFSAEDSLLSLDRVDLDKVGGNQLALCSKELLHDEIVMNVVVDGTTVVVDGMNANGDTSSKFMVKFDMANVATALQKVLAEQLKLTDDERPMASCYNDDGGRLVARLSITDVGYLQALNNVVLLEAETFTQGLMEYLKETNSCVHIDEQDFFKGGAPSAVNDDSYLEEVQVRCFLRYRVI